MAAYYNEHDAKTAAWLRELIKAGVIADDESHHEAHCLLSAHCGSHP
jgi:hypothetical protein